MAYFEEHYADVRFPLATATAQGFRNAQIGATFAIVSHFTLRTEPALVVMPTGSGKTAVLILSAFLLRAQRVLVITPSVLVRDQIEEEFRTLKTLIRLGALPKEILGPKVKTVTSRLTTPESWENLRVFDVVVATPNSASPGHEDIPQPSTELFDLILIDEAHHSPARTWSELFMSFPSARRVLFTATPFRRDRREIAGRFVYTYSLRRAYEDGVFGKIRYIPIISSDILGTDAAVAVAAQEELRRDQEAGYSHRLMVRTDTRAKADELKDTYRRYTDLKLQVVHSRYSYKHVTETIKKLREGTLDGIICVAMLGEGFDLPELKIAAVHAPHKSLEVTLQFIGRFARTSKERLGEAKFLAAPNDIRIETERLYEEDAAWQEIVANLSASRIEAEARTRDDLETFEVGKLKEGGLADLSLYSLSPYVHVKIYSVESADLSTAFKLPPGFSVVFSSISESLSAGIFITQEIKQPKWTEHERFQRLEYDLFVLYYDRHAGLLFINSSRRTLSLYEMIGGSISGYTHKILPIFKINRVLRHLASLECFSVGMRNRARGASMESYRMIAGSRAHKAISPTAGRLFHRGHIFARTGDITIGYSSGSKVWSNIYLKIPALVQWCRELALKIVDDSSFITNSELDNLPISRPVEELPDVVLAVDWDEDAYVKPFRLVYKRDGRIVHECAALDCDLVLDKADGIVRISSSVFQYPVRFRLGAGRFFEPAIGPEEELHVVLAEEEVDIVAYLNNQPLSFFTPDFSRVRGEEIFPGWEEVESYPRDQIIAWDWLALGVDISKEFGPGSIHEYLKVELFEKSSILIYDHGSGETADFVSIKEEGNVFIIALYHCKSSGGDSPGERVSDVYEVCGQVVKSTMWLARLDRLTQRLEKRVEGASQLLKGTSRAMKKMLERAAREEVRYEIILVQPGIAMSRSTEKTLSVIAAANEFVKMAGPIQMKVIGSA